MILCFHILLQYCLRVGASVFLSFISQYDCVTSQQNVEEYSTFLEVAIRAVVEYKEHMKTLAGEELPADSNNLSMSL